jgi:hypothetical protein
MFFNTHSKEMLSKQPLMSPSSIHGAELGFDKALKALATASAHALPSLKP